MFRPNRQDALLPADAGAHASGTPDLGVGGFDSLTLALEGWFDSDLCDLPDGLRQRVDGERRFVSMPWDGLTAQRRRTLALERDYRHDPGTEQDRQSWWKSFERMDVVKAEIAQWEATATPTAGERALREGRLKDLRQELDRINLRERRSRSDYRPKGQQAATRDAPSSTRQDGPVQFVAYPKALHQMAARLSATPEEMAAWIWDGPDNGGIAAYLHANELDPPPRFAFPEGDYVDGDDDYVAPLMACWFRADELDRFEPKHRYITGSALIARWQERPGLKAEAYIRAKIRELSLLNLHPIYGFTQVTASEDASSPPLISGLFKLSEVEQVEAEEFPEAPAAEDRLPTALMQASDGAVAGQITMEALAAEQPVAADTLNPTADPTEGGKDQETSAASGDSSRCTAGLAETGNSRTSPEMGSVEWRREKARAAANAKHDRPDGSREKQRKLQEFWASGKYSTRSICAEQECAALGMAYATAVKALRNTPDPVRS